MQVIGVHSELEKSVVTLLVMRHFSNLLGAPRSCVDFRDSTDFFRFNMHSPAGAWEQGYKKKFLNNYIFL